MSNTKENNNVKIYDVVFLDAFPIHSNQYFYKSFTYVLYTRRMNNFPVKRSEMCVPWAHSHYKYGLLYRKCNHCFDYSLKHS